MDKAGQAYILHPLRIMQKVQHPDAKIVAVLHDILEDTPTSADDLLALGFSSKIVDAVQAVTKKDGENRFQAVQRTVKNAIACEVKLADLSDNMNLSRLPTISAKDLARFNQYLKIRDILLNAQNIYDHLTWLNIDIDYPAFTYRSLRKNYQYILNAMFDEQHEIGGLNIGLPKEWWILFEDTSAYFAYCKRKGIVPLEVVYLQLINTTDLDYFGQIFQDDDSQALFRSMFETFMQFHFEKDINDY